MGNRLAQVRADRGWKKARLLHELRAAAARRNERLPKDESLSRRIAVWENQGGVVGEFYRDLLCEVYGLTAAELGLIEAAPTPTPPTELSERPTFTRLDSGLVGLLRGQTQSIRMLDRRLGGAAIYCQTRPTSRTSSSSSATPSPTGTARPPPTSSARQPPSPAGRHSTSGSSTTHGDCTKSPSRPRARADGSPAWPTREHSRRMCFSTPANPPTHMP
jgi:hypothetical protein